MQIQKPGTHLIPTRKIVDFLGIRAMEGEAGDDASASLQFHTDRERLRQEKSRRSSDRGLTGADDGVVIFERRKSRSGSFAGGRDLRLHWQVDRFV